MTTQIGHEHPAYKATITRISDTEARIEREFDAPREAVWEIVTDPALIPEWWGPARMRTTVLEMDVRVGGRWRYESTDRDTGDSVVFSGEYRVLDRPERIVQTFSFNLAPGHEVVEDATYSELPCGRTKLTVLAAHNDKEGLDGMLAAGMESGMNEGYDRLDALLAARVTD
jgi:uncharacterized protein YndB with AHSA1/START domain